MDKAEFQNLTGKSAAQVRKLCDKGEFYVAGHGYFRAVKVGKGKTCPIDIRLIRADDGGKGEETEPTGAVETSRMNALKQAKYAVDIQIAQQKLHEKQEAIERNFANEVISKVIAALQPLKEAFRSCKLTKEQSDLIDAALTESLRRVESLSNQ